MPSSQPSPSFSRWSAILSAADSSRSLSRPGGNLSGFTKIENSLGGKWVELLKEIAPRVARVVIVFDPAMAPLLPIT
jgi:hypothetical protein